MQKYEKVIDLKYKNESKNTRSSFRHKSNQKNRNNKMYCP